MGDTPSIRLNKVSLTQRSKTTLAAAPVELPIELLRLALESLQEAVVVVDSERRVLLWNNGAEKVSGIPRLMVMGKPTWDTELAFVDAGGNALKDDKCPVRQTMEDGQERLLPVFVQHRTGYRIPVMLHTVATGLLGAETPACLMTFADQSPRQDLESYGHGEDESTLVDPLTGLANEAFFRDRVAEAIAQKRLYETPCCLIYWQVDYLKSLAARYGNNFRDDVLKVVARDLTNALRATDFLTRFGEDKFLGLLRGCPKAQAVAAATRCRGLVASSRLRAGGSDIWVSVSCGVTEAQFGDSPTDWLNRAESVLKGTVSAGRNQVLVS
jgi:diguanylate cyclase (GGDEF)-like protein/PAS domain S-box-containing protein